MESEPSSQPNQSTQPVTMCSLHRLLLNCILFFHLAPQLTQWSHSGARHDRVTVRTTGGDHQTNHLPHHSHAFIDWKTTQCHAGAVRSSSHYDLNHSPGRPVNHGHTRVTHPYGSHDSHYNSEHKSNQNAHKSPKTLRSSTSLFSSSSPPSSSLSNPTLWLVNFASNPSNSPGDLPVNGLISPVASLNYPHNHLDNPLDDSDNHLNQKPPCVFNQKSSKSSDLLSHASSSFLADASSISIHQSDSSGLPTSPDHTVQDHRRTIGWLNLPIQFSTFMLFELFVHLNEKPLWINRPVGAYAVSADMRAHRKFISFIHLIHRFFRTLLELF